MSDLIDLFCKSRDQRKVKHIAFGWWPIMQILHNITFNGFYLNSISVRFVLVYCLDLQPLCFWACFLCYIGAKLFSIYIQKLKVALFSLQLISCLKLKLHNYKILWVSKNRRPAMVSLVVKSYRLSQKNDTGLKT